jgi:hypothetical protein
VASILEKYSDDPVIEVAETCQLALSRMKFFADPENASTNSSKSSYASVDPAPPAEMKDTSNLRQILLDENALLFDRYRAMFSLRNLCTEESVLSLAEGKLKCLLNSLLRVSNICEESSRFY